MKRKDTKCRVCDCELKDGADLCGKHWQELSRRGYPITARKIKKLREELEHAKESHNED